MNVLLDGYPEEYEGYLVRTDFRIGMQICMCLGDEELEENERLGTVLELLYGNGMPEIETALSGLSWFMNGGRTQEEKGVPRNEEEEPEKAFDFEADAERIMSAFQKAYKIDLSRENMHWFQFLSLLGDVGECAFTNVVNIRTKKLTSDMSPEQRATYSELKKRYSLVKYTKEEQEKIAEFFSRLTE